MSEYQDALDYLFNQFPQYQKVGKKAYKADLSNITSLCNIIGNPQKDLKCIHLAGTNGKGSTAHMLAAILQQAKHKVGIFTSPHLTDFRERIKIGNWVETNGFSGEVIDINLKEFVLKEADNNIVIIPNKDVLESPLKNYSLTTRMRVKLECGVGYESDLDKVETLTKETIANNTLTITTNIAKSLYSAFKKAKAPS